MPMRDAVPEPFLWTKSADEILASTARFAQRTFDFQIAPPVQQWHARRYQAHEVAGHPVWPR